MSWSEIGRYNASTPDGDVETVILEKDDQGMYKKFSPSGVLLLEIQPIKCKEEKKYSRASNSKGMEVGVYKCFKLIKSIRCSIAFFPNETVFGTWIK